MKLKDSKLFQQKCYINGKWLSADSTIQVNNPSKGTPLGTVPNLGADEVCAAVEAASLAFPLWSAKTAKERSQILRRWFDLIVEHADDLATILTSEQGKPLAEALGEIRYGSQFIEWYAEEAKRAYGDIIPSVIQGQRLFVIKQPVGVVGAITPWNFPHAMITRKCAPALAAGCTIVIKPAEATPFSALALAVLAERAGIPPGVFNIVTGDPAPIGQELSRNPLVRKMTFTGSTRVGKLLMQQCAEGVKKMSLELGGSAPFLVFADANIPYVLEGLLASKFRNSGQTCVCADRIFVEDQIYDRFSLALVDAVKKLKVGDGFESGVQIGPLINMAAVEKIEGQIEEALSKGAKILCGGKRHFLGLTFFEPTVLCHVKPEMRIGQEETFGPVVPLIRFQSEADVIEMANNSEYGLASYLYTRDPDRIWRVAERLENGIVSVNCGIFSNEVTPFGGVKQSGLGREGSRYGLDEYLEMKYICMGSSTN